MSYIEVMREKFGHDLIQMTTAGAVLYNVTRDSILLTGRTDSDKGYGFPSGFVELGESAPETLVREFKEELGLDVRVAKLLGVSTKFVAQFRNGDKQQTMGMMFEVELIDPNQKIDHIQADELTFAKWVPLNPTPTMFIEQAQDTMNHIAANEIPWFV
ncbi:MAG: NUDIX domain-containing protein [Lactobacillaceae bacterium]|jgi:ADP-ribose pyrophosphatase YjhB (NUDIX family)|nr:NUDIX domain-containing protein [Lactobacillaceae bacterium]